MKYFLFEKKRKGLCIIALIIICIHVFPQNVLVDYNEKYKYPVSFGVEYQNLSPLKMLGTDYDADFQMNDISLIVRVPIQSIPVLQPLIQIGMLSVVSVDRLDLEGTEKFNHTHWYGTAGFGYSNMFSKQLEMGADIAAGVSEAIFPKLDESGPRGSVNLIASAGAAIALNISYNLSLNIHPNMKYIHFFTPLDRFNGFTFGIGITGNYRLGEDPDAPQATIRSIKFSEVTIPPVFAAMQSFYVKNPICNVTVTNSEKYTLTDMDVSFFQAEYMDTKTKAASISELGPGESRDIDIFASFNREVFLTEGITPLTGEIIIDYNARGRMATQSLPVSYDLYDKEALTWDDDRKAAAFITPADSALRNYSSYVRQVCKDAVGKGLSENLQTAIQIFYSLAEIGCIYQVDPTSPFESAKGNPLIVDSISLPRNTLKRAAGDCDDLTVLFCSLLETVGIETGFITVPGHIYAAFNTKVKSKDYKTLNPDKSMTLNIEGNLWVPVEITLIGQSSFLTAWRRGAEEFNAFKESPEKRALNITRASQEIYRPVVLQETDLGLQYGDKSNVIMDFKKDKDKLVSSIIDGYESDAKEKRNKGSYNKLGIISAQFGLFSGAEKAFNIALSLDRNYLAPKINLGNVFYMKEEYQNALRVFHSAESSLIEKGKESSSIYTKVLLSISKSYYELENYDKASEYSNKLAATAPELAKKYLYLSRAGGGSRASDISAFKEVIFLEEE